MPVIDPDDVHRWEVSTDHGHSWMLCTVSARSPLAAYANDGTIPPAPATYIDYSSGYHYRWSPTE